MIIDTDIQKNFRDIHKNKMGFLLGTGASLGAINEDLLKPYVTMAVNISIVKFPYATYYTSCDGSTWIDNFLDYIPQDSNTTIILDKSLYEWGASKYKEDDKVWGYEKNQDRNNVSGNPDSSKLIFGVSSIHPSFHLMNVMGCNPIVLLGCECKYINGIYSFYMLPEFEDKLHEAFKIRRKGNYSSLAEWHIKTQHFGDGYSGNTDAHLLTTVGYWKRMNWSNKDLTVIDACDSIINCFPKMKLEDVLAKYGDRTI